METMNELKALLDDLARKLTETASAIRNLYSEPEEQPFSKDLTQKDQSAPEAPQNKQLPEKTYSKEAVRAILASKANESDGKFKKDVRTIVKKYGHGGSLTDIDPKDYPAVVKETEELANA